CLRGARLVNRPMQAIRGSRVGALVTSLQHGMVCAMADENSNARPSALHAMTLQVQPRVIGRYFDTVKGVCLGGVEIVIDHVDIRTVDNAPAGGNVRRA